MKAMERARNAWRKGTRVLLAQTPALKPEDQEAWNDAVALWDQLFDPFSPLTDDADVLELGCGDGRMLGALSQSGRVRSATGIERYAYWNGEGGGAPWRTGMFPALQLHAEMRKFENLDDGEFDLILCRELDGFFPLDGLEDVLSRIYGLLRPGGEMIVRLRCGDGGPGFRGPGYGFMTPTAWIALMLGAGFEVAGLRGIERDPASRARLMQRLPHASDDERMTAELHLHLVRPWESWELDALREFGDQRKRPKKA